MKHSEKAAELFTKGYNCAQAVVCAFCDKTGLDETTALKLSSSFGGGMGRLRQTCGAVTGAFMVAGLLNGYTTSDDDQTKKEHYALIQDIAKRFTEKNASINCHELLGKLGSDTLPTPTPRTAEYYATRPCVRFVIQACDILDEIIEEKGL